MEHRISVWRTGHEIADTVARMVRESLRCDSFDTCLVSNKEHYERLTPTLIPEYGVHIGYGILRGCDEVFRECDKQNKPWFNIDRGYWKPGHYDGYYRISLRGTQQTNLTGLKPDYERWQQLGVQMQPWRGFDYSKETLICPPTEHVERFFGIDWLKDAEPWLRRNGFCIRSKGDPTPINFNDYNYVLTFNSSVGWQALAAGIPCVSDPTHSIVGSRYRDISLENLQDIQYRDREALFGIQASLQLTLSEIKQGKLWPLVQKLLSI